MYKTTLKKISQSRHAVIIAASSFVILLIVSALVLLKFADIQRGRDLLGWETRINIIADSRANAVNEWVERQFTELDALAQNQSLQLYSSQIQQSGPTQKEDPFQTSYLRNLLFYTAERSGFSGQAQQTINANVPVQSTSGIVILDKNKKILVSTTTMPPLGGRLAEIIMNLPQQERYISNIYKGVDDKPTIVLSVPIPSLQGEDDSKNYVGCVVGIRTVDDSLFPLLKQPGDTGKTAESFLVRVEGNIINYLSPTRDGGAALSKNLHITPESDANFAVVNPGQFAIKRDYAFNEVLVSGRKIANTPWTLVYKIDRNEALSESDSNTRNLLTIGIISILFIAAAIIAIWQYTNFVKESRLAERYRKMMLDLKAQKHILRLITDNKPEVTFIVDDKNLYRFANLKAAQEAGLNAKEMIGQAMVGTMEKEKALRYVKMNATSMADKQVVSTVHRSKINGQEKIIQSYHIPLPHIPSTDDGKYRDGVLVIEQDITNPIQAKEKLVRTLKALIDTLVSFMDRRDHYTADHSSRVSKLSVAIATEMGLDEISIETARISGTLLNLGKVLVPLNLLTKTAALTKDEKKIFENTINVSAELIRDIEFEGPVIDTILQSKERVDGKGRLKLKEENILITARIVSVANAFVSLRSPRAYRLIKTLDESMELINADAGKSFDRKVVAAMVNYLENRGGRKEWSKDG